MRTVASLVLAVFASTAVAGEALPIAASYGNDGGCQMLKTDAYDNDDWITLTPTEYAGHEWSCSFKWVSEPENFGGGYTAPNGSKRTLFAWSIIALCGGEGSAWADLIAVQDHGDTVEVASQDDGENGPTYLKQCP